MDVLVGVGGWEHLCCRDAIVRDQLVDLLCIRYTGSDGRPRLVETHHDLDIGAGERVRGRVTDLQAVQDGGVAQPVLRVPSGAALRGFDEDDDGHLEAPWTGEVVASESGGENGRHAAMGHQMA